MPKKVADEVKVCGYCPKKLEILKKAGSRLAEKDCNGVCGGKARTICEQCTDKPGNSLCKLFCNHEKGITLSQVFFQVILK